MDPNKTKVILVGNSTFPRWGDEIKDIPNVEENLDRLRKILFDVNYFGIPNDSKHLVEIRNETSQEILMKVKHETKSFDERKSFEKLIFYYSGHGIPGEDQKLFFAAKDTVRRDYELTSVDSHRLFSYLKAFDAKELIIILDCCYAAQTKENQGDADSLIEKCLPPEETKIATDQNGTYYLFAAGRDNVAKFNPETPKEPTFFTQALLNVVETGTEIDEEIITTGKLYEYLRKEITNQRKINPDIPDPRQGTEGDAILFPFCKNKRHESEEDKDWFQLLKDPNPDKVIDFRKKYPQTRYDAALDKLGGRLLKGKKEIKEMKRDENYEAGERIKRDYGDIPYIRNQADEFMQKLLAEESDSAKEKVAERLDLNDKIEIDSSGKEARQSGVTPVSPDLTKATDKITIDKESSVLTDSPSIRSEKDDKTARSSIAEQRP